MQALAASGRCPARASGAAPKAAVAAAVAVLPRQCRRPAPLRVECRQQVASRSSRSGTGLLSASSTGSILQLRHSSSRPRHGRVPLRAAGAAAAAAADGGAADAGAGGADAPPPAQQQRQAQQPWQPKQKPPRELSLQQRWRAIKFGTLEAQQRVAQQLSQVPAVAALLAALAALNQRLQPLYDAWRGLQKGQEDLIDMYNQFLAEETKRQWRWSKQFEKEIGWWARVPPFIGFFAVTLVYQAFMPVSFAACVGVPLYYSWVLWDIWWVSPVFLATLLASPLKWVPWADKCLVWPGLI